MLFLSEATVKTHVTRIFAKLGVRDRVGAVVTGADGSIGTDYMIAPHRTTRRTP